MYSIHSYWILDTKLCIVFGSAIAAPVPSGWRAARERRAAPRVVCPADAREPLVTCSARSGNSRAEGTNTKRFVILSSGVSVSVAVPYIPCSQKPHVCSWFRVPVVYHVRVDRGWVSTAHRTVQNQSVAVGSEASQLFQKELKRRIVEGDRLWTGVAQIWRWLQKQNSEFVVFTPKREEQDKTIAEFEER